MMHMNLAQSDGKFARPRTDFDTLVVIVNRGVESSLNLSPLSEPGKAGY